MAKAQAKKTAVRTKRRERKNIEKGQVHIRSSFNNTIVTITDLAGKPFPGRPPADWASAAAESPLLLRLRPLPRPLPRLRWSTV